jgi:integrase
MFRRGSWYARVTFTDPATGQRRDRTKACESKAAAKEQRDEWLLQLDETGSESIDKALRTFADFAAWFKSNYLVPATYTPDGQKEHGLRSLYSAELNFAVVCRYFGQRPLREIRYADLRAFRLHRLETPTRSGGKRALATINREVGMARRMFKIARRQGWITRDPFDEGDPLIFLSRERERERILTREEEVRLLAACARDRENRLRPLVIAALDTGCRQGELLKLVWSDVDFDRGIITIRAFNSKTMRERIVGITPRLRAMLREIRPRRCKPDGRVFGMSHQQWFCKKRVWTSARRDAGLLDVRFHDLRHTAASRLARKMSLSDVGKLLGHREPRTTWRYANITETTITDAVAILHAFTEAE